MVEMEKIHRNPDTKYRIEKIAPDGGYGWIVGIGLAIAVVCIFCICLKCINLKINSINKQLT